MDVPFKRAANRIKGALAERQGPVEKNQDAAPIAEAMRAFWERDMLSFAIPAHNGGRGPKSEVSQRSPTAHSSRAPQIRRCQNSVSSTRRAERTG
jgi:hypothetical protein